MFEHALTVGKIAASLGSAMVGGTFFAFSTFLMRVLQQLPPAQGMAVMQTINQVIVASLFLPVFLASTVLSLGLAVAAPFAAWSAQSTLHVIAGAALYLIGVFGVTIAFNVPRNNALAKLLPFDEQSPARWSEYVQSWTRYNHVRTIAAALATIFFLL